MLIYNKNYNSIRFNRLFFSIYLIDSILLFNLNQYFTKFFGSKIK